MWNNVVRIEEPIPHVLLHVNSSKHVTNDMFVEFTFIPIHIMNFRDSSIRLLFLFYVCVFLFAHCFDRGASIGWRICNLFLAFLRQI